MTTLITPRIDFLKAKITECIELSKTNTCKDLPKIEGEFDIKINFFSDESEEKDLEPLTKDDKDWMKSWHNVVGKYDDKTNTISIILANNPVMGKVEKAYKSISGNKNAPGGFGLKESGVIIDIHAQTKVVLAHEIGHVLDYSYLDPKNGKRYPHSTEKDSLMAFDGGIEPFKADCCWCKKILEFMK